MSGRNDERQGAEFSRFADWSLETVVPLDRNEKLADEPQPLEPGYVDEARVAKPAWQSDEEHVLRWIEQETLLFKDHQMQGELVSDRMMDCALDDVLILTASEQKVILVGNEKRLAGASRIRTG